VNQNPIDRILIRTKDVALLISILTLGTMLWNLYKKPTQWDQAYNEVVELKPRVENLERVMTANTERFNYIIRELDQIEKKVDR
jgi:hypothetical protein